MTHATAHLHHGGAGASVSVAERLVEIVRSLTREQALAMGQGSDLRFEHIPVAQIDIIKRAIGR